MNGVKFLLVGIVITGTAAGLLLITSRIKERCSQIDNPQQLPRYTNSLGMEFVLIPPGEFIMGSRNGRSNEAPIHRVKITRAFYMQTTEVSHSQFKQVMGFSPYLYADKGQYEKDFQGRIKYNPVSLVSWGTAQTFINELNKKECTNKYRLPTEAEWEYACRAGSTGKWCFGNDEETLQEYAYFEVDGKNHSPRDVAKGKPNAWGLYDMHGNVSEWVNDYYEGDYYSRSPVTDPKGPASGRRFIVRGGCFGSKAESCRSATRLGVDFDLFLDNWGFRLCMDAGP